MSVLCASGENKKTLTFLAGFPAQEKRSRKSLQLSELYQQTKVKQLYIHASHGPKNE